MRQLKLHPNLIALAALSASAAQSTDLIDLSPKGKKSDNDEKMKAGGAEMSTPKIITREMMLASHHHPVHIGLAEEEHATSIPTSRDKKHRYIDQFGAKHSVAGAQAAALA